MGTVGYRSWGELPIRRAAMTSLVFLAAVTVDGGGLVTAVGGGMASVTAREGSSGLSAATD